MIIQIEHLSFARQTNSLFGSLVRDASSKTRFIDRSKELESFFRIFDLERAVKTSLIRLRKVENARVYRKPTAFLPKKITFEVKGYAGKVR